MTRHEAIMLLIRIGHRGPTPAMYANVHEAFKTLAREGVGHEAMRQMLVQPSVSAGAFNFIKAIFNQPYGYPGDFELLGKYYDAYDQNYDDYLTDEAKASECFPSNWDNYLLSRPVAQSVYNREKYLLKRVDELVEAKRINSVLDIACGDGRLIGKILDKYPRLYCRGIDGEPEAIKKAKARGLEFTRFEEMNVLTRLPDYEFDLVISAGLFDYLSDGHASRLVRRIHQYMKPKNMIIGNMKAHDNMAEMSLLRWELIYRESVDMIALSAACDTAPPGLHTVDYDHTGINMFLNYERYLV
jgi:SAM-dependent methyltransferase